MNNSISNQFLGAGTDVLMWEPGDMTRYEVLVSYIRTAEMPSWMQSFHGATGDLFFVYVSTEDKAHVLRVFGNHVNPSDLYFLELHRTRCVVAYMIAQYYGFTCGVSRKMILDREV